MSALNLNFAKKQYLEVKFGLVQIGRVLIIDLNLKSNNLQTWSLLLLYPFEVEMEPIGNQPPSYQLEAAKETEDLKNWELSVGGN